MLEAGVPPALKSAMALSSWVQKDSSCQRLQRISGEPFPAVQYISAKENLPHFQEEKPEKTRIQYKVLTAKHTQA